MIGRGRSRLAVWLVVAAAGVAPAGCGGDGQAHDLQFRLSRATPPLLPVRSVSAGGHRPGLLPPPGADAGSGGEAPAAADVPSGGDVPAGGDVRATLIGDSVASAIALTPAARRELNRGMHTTLDLRACRRLAGVSCTFQGSTPSTALQEVRDRGDGLGSVLVVDVGYNDETAGYAANLDRIVRAARAQGAERIVWVTLREAGPAPDTYHATNEIIRQATQRWPQLEIADWNAQSAGKPWFGGDGLHLGPEGAVALARFLRPYIAGAS